MATAPELCSANRWRGNIHLYFGTIQFDSRTLKITRSLTTHGLAQQIHMLGIWEPGLKVHEQVDAQRQIHRFRLLVPRVSGNTLFQMLRIGEFSLRALCYALGKHIELVNCHMLMLLPACVVLKKALRAELVYEPHEIESEQESITGRKSRLLRRVEGKLLKYAEMVVHVSRPCAQWYEQAFGIGPVPALNNTPLAASIRNIPPTPVLRKRLGIGAQDLVFIFQGQFRERADLELILKVFAACPDKTRHVVLMGFGPYEELVKESAQRHANIHFLPAVPPAEILSYTAGADIGLCILLGTTTNTRHMIPNKAHEYFLSGIPVIATPLPAMSHFVNERSCGWLIEGTEQALAALVAGITRDEVQRFRQHIESVRHNYGWENEEKTLLRIYEELWGKRRRQRCEVLQPAGREAR